MKLMKIQKFVMFNIVPIAVGVLLLFISFLVGVFELPRDGSNRDIRFFNAGIAAPIIVTCFWLSIKYSFHKALLCLYKFARGSRTSKQILEVRHLIYKRRRMNFTISLCVGAFMSVFYLKFEGLIASDLDKVTIYMNVLALPFWTVSSMVILQVISITQIVITNFLTLQKIQLFDIKKLMPISDLVIVNIIITAVCISLVPLFWLGKEIPKVDLVIGALVFSALAIFQFQPVIKVQKMVSQSKELAIKRINVQYQKQFTVSELETLSIIDEPSRLRTLSALINAKQEISNSSEWPLDLPQGARALLLSLSIPLSWAMGSLIESVIGKLVA